MRRALAAAGQVASDAGQDVEAARHFLRAGRSAAAQGGVARAMQWLGRARELARQGGDTGTAAQAEDALAALPR